MRSDPIPDPPADTRPPAAAWNAPTILVVDDEAAIVDMLRDVLSAEGYTVLIARDGHAGLVAARDTALHLILTDIMMPMMDGFEFCRQLRADPRTAQLPVIAMSAAYHPEDGVQFNAVLAKPFELTALFAVLDAHLGTSPPA